MNLAIVPTDGRDEEKIRAISELHAVLLPDSPVSKLGRRFMEKFYYRHLIREGLIHADLVKADGKYVAFASYTAQPFTFMQLGQQGHMFYLIFLNLFLIGTAPRRLAIIFKALFYKKERFLAREQQERTGELLSFGVLESYAPMKLPDGRRLPNGLFERVLEFFKDKKFETLQMIIRKTNRASLLFFHSYGAKIQEAGYIDSSTYLMSLSLGKKEA